MKREKIKGSRYRPCVNCLAKVNRAIIRIISSCIPKDRSKVSCWKRFVESGKRCLALVVDLVKLLVKLLDQGLKIGRDALFELLGANHLLVPRKRSRVRTTHSYHLYKKYPNLIRSLSISRPGQLWVSDITYIDTEQGFVYLFLITDAYSRKIIGFKTAHSLEAKHAVEALHMALRGLHSPAKELIHHSDRGIQYCCQEYVQILENKGIRISMTENGDPLGKCYCRASERNLERSNGFMIKGLKTLFRYRDMLIRLLAFITRKGHTLA